jgi:hypothetical protein
VAGAALSPTYNDEDDKTKTKTKTTINKITINTKNNKRKRTKKTEGIIYIVYDSFAYTLNEYYMVFPKKAFEGFYISTGAKRA